MVRYIALLLVCGVITPICLCTGPAATGPGKATGPSRVLAHTRGAGSGVHFSFIRDVAAKLLPAAELFK